MEQMMTGALIKQLRLEKKQTQNELAERLGVTAQAVSKWERGLGCPDPSLLGILAKELEVDVDTLLAGSLNSNEASNGNMKKTKIYVCPRCGNIITASAGARVSCCGKLLQPQKARKAAPEEALNVQVVENDYFISSDHPMTKEHYIAFVMLLNDDGMMLRRLYPEWDMQTRLPFSRHGTLMWYCTKDGLMYKYI